MCDLHPAAHIKPCAYTTLNLGSKVVLIKAYDRSWCHIRQAHCVPKLVLQAYPYAAAQDASAVDETMPMPLTSSSHALLGPCLPPCRWRKYTGTPGRSTAAFCCLPCTPLQTAMQANRVMQCNAGAVAVLVHNRLFACAVVGRHTCHATHGWTSSNRGELLQRCSCCFTHVCTCICMYETDASARTCAAA